MGDVGIGIGGFVVGCLAGWFVTPIVSRYMPRVLAIVAVALAAGVVYATIVQMMAGG